MSRVLIIGAGGHARELADVVQACRDDGRDIELVGFLDDDSSRHGQAMHEAEVLGGLDWLQRTAANDLTVIIGIGSPATKQRVAHRLSNSDISFDTLVHPHASITRYVTFHPGVVITAGCVLTHTIELGSHVHVNRCVTIGHDCKVGSFTHLAPGVVLSGNVKIGEQCDIGTNACVLPGRSVGSKTIVGAGAVVTRDLPESVTAIGVPARVLRKAEQP